MAVPASLFADNDCPQLGREELEDSVVLMGGLKGSALQCWHVCVCGISMTVGWIQKALLGGLGHSHTLDKAKQRGGAFSILERKGTGLTSMRKISPVVEAWRLILAEVAQVLEK